MRQDHVGGAAGRRHWRLKVPLAGYAVLTLAACAPSQARKVETDRSAEPAMTVSVAAVKRRAVSRAVTATGTVMPWQELTIAAPTSALTVAEVRVKENDTVRAGDLLVRFDGRALEAQVAQQKAAVAEAQATLESSKREAARGEALVLQKAMSVETVETRRTTIRTSRAKLDQALASLDQLQVQLDQTFVRAPTDGVVSLEPIRLGAVPSAGTELVRLIRDGRLEVQTKVPERELAAVKAEQVAAVAAPDGSRWRGRVRDVAAKVDAATRLGVVYVGLPANAPLRAGMFAGVAIDAGTSEPFVIPERALVWANGKVSAFVIDRDGIAHLKRLTTGSRQDGMIAVQAGLEAGDRVAIAGAGFLHDGDKVRVAPALGTRDTAGLP